MDYTIDLLIAMVVEEIAEETGKDRKDILIDFLSSKTGKFLYDELQNSGEVDLHTSLKCICRK